MKNSEFLKLVKEELYNTRSQGFICFAIDQVAKDNTSTTNLKSWVNKLLGIHYTYGSWLAVNHPKKYLEYQNAKSPIEPRIQWVTWMIKYWQRKERKMAT